MRTTADRLHGRMLSVASRDDMITMLADNECRRLRLVQLLKQSTHETSRHGRYTRGEFAMGLPTRASDDIRARVKDDLLVVD